MRIDCDQCSAAFTIDDAMISDRGVRAQCPKCGHQKVVKKTAAAPPTLPTSSTPQNPFNALTGAKPTAGLGAPPANPFGGASAAQNPFAPSGPSAAPANPFGAPTGGAAPDPFAGGGNPFGGAPAPSPPSAPSAPPAPSATPFGGGGNPFGGAPANPFGAPSSPDPAGAAANPFGGALNPFGASTGAPPQGASTPPQSPPQSPPQNPFGGAPAPSANPFGAPQNPFGGPSPAPSANPFGGSPAGGSPFGGAPAAASPFGAPSPSPTPSSTSGGGSPFGGEPAGGNPFGGGGNPFGPATGTNTPAKADADPFAGMTGGNDPFTGAPTGAAAAPGGAPTFDAPPTTGPGPGQWALRTAVGEEYLDVGELRERVKAGTVRPDDLCGPAGETPKPAREQPALNINITTTAERPRVAGARASGSNLSLPRPLVAAILGIAVVGGGGFAVYKIKPELFERQSEAGINPLRRARTLWQRQFPDVEGTAQEHLVEGRQQMRLDTAAGYRKADEELRQSLLLDVGNVAAIAAWAENFANLPTVRADLEGSTLAREAVDYGLKREPTNVDLIRAEGALALALGSVDESLRILTRAKSAAPGDVDTLVWLAKANLDRSPEQALAVVQRDVRAKAPDLKIAYTIEGAAHRRLGAFKKAREMLDARLVSDPGNVGALKEMAKLELDLGQANAALAALTKLLEAEDKDVEAHLLRAKITYQIRGGPEGLKDADAQLTEVLSKHEGAAGDLLLSVLAHASFVKGQLGEVDAAIALGERARATDPSFAAALFALGRAYAQKGDLENAKTTFEQAVRATTGATEFYEPLVRAELAAVQARAGDEQNAIRNNEKVIDYDPRNMRAHFSLASIYMKNGKFTQANTIMRRALSNDPNWERDRLVPTDFPTPGADLNVFADLFRDAKMDPKDESLLSLRASAEGMIRFHAGDRDRAGDLLTRALKLDRYNHAALLYQGLLDLDAGRPAFARKRFQVALDTTASSDPLTRMYLARSLLASGDVEGARKRLQDLVETEPTLVQARYSLAIALRKQELEAQAQNELRSVVRQDPDFLPAKQALANN